MWKRWLNVAETTVAVRVYLPEQYGLRKRWLSVAETSVAETTV